MADELQDQHCNVLYGKIASYTADSMQFDQNCDGKTVTHQWDEIRELRYSGDCSAAKSWRGGREPECVWVDDPNVIVTMEMYPEVPPMIGGQPATLPYGVATEVFGRDGNQLHYRDVCTGLDALIPLEDLVIWPNKGYFARMCE